MGAIKDEDEDDLLTRQVKDADKGTGGVGTTDVGSPRDDEGAQPH